MYEKVIRDARRAKRRAHATADELARRTEVQDDMKRMADMVGTPAAEDFREHIQGQRTVSNDPFKPMH